MCVSLKMNNTTDLYLWTLDDYKNLYDSFIVAYINDNKVWNNLEIYETNANITIQNDVQYSSILLCPTHHSNRIQRIILTNRFDR